MNECRNIIFVALPAVFAAAALVLSSISVLDCDFVRFVAPPPASGRSHARTGLWNYMWWDHDGGRYACRAYPPADEDGMGGIEIDGWWRASRVFGASTLDFGGLAVALNASLLVYDNFCRRNCCFESGASPSSSIRSSVSTNRLPPRPLRCCTSAATNQADGILYVIACLCSSLTLLFLKSNACQHNRIFNLTGNHECRLSTGARCTYASMLMWFVASASALYIEERGEGGRRRAGTAEGEGGNGDGDGRCEPLLQDSIFECEQSVYSGSQLSNQCNVLGGND